MGGTKIDGEWCHIGVNHEGSRINHEKARKDQCAMRGLQGSAVPYGRGRCKLREDFEARSFGNIGGSTGSAYFFEEAQLGKLA